MQTLTVTLPTPHKAQLGIINASTRFNCVCCGRRFGKSLMGTERVVHPMLKGAPVGWFAPSYKMLLDSWRVVKQALAPVTKHSSETEKRLELITGGVLDMWSLDNPDAGRGKKYKRVIIDEAAMVARLEEAWTAAIRPTLTDLRGDAYFFSTPKGHNYFKTLFDWGNDPLKPDWQSWQLPTSANPYIPADEIEAARQSMPERTFRQEYLAEFIDDAGVFRNVRACVGAVQQEKRQPGHGYVIGADWGKLEDFTVFTVLDTTTNEVCYVDRFNQIDYHTQVSRLGALFDRFKPYNIIAERNSMGEPVIEILQRQGLPVQPFTTTNSSKQAAIDALQVAFERQEISIPADPVLIAELQAFEAQRLPSGMLRYSAPDGYHDDMVMSLALAWSGGRQSGFILFGG